MKQKEKLLSLLLVLLMLVTAAVTVNRRIFNHSVRDDSNTVNEVKEKIDPVINLGDDNIVIHTGDLEGTINGYAGPVKMDIYIKDGKISEIRTLENSETPSFFNRAKALTDKWIGKSPAEALDVKADAVSGATYSSMAIINNVRVGLAYYEGSDKNFETTASWKIWVALFVTLCACIIPLFVKNKYYHTIQILANIIVLGFWCGQFLDYTLILKYISGGFLFPGALVAIVMLIAAFIYPLFGHPQHYCNHICPLGSAQQLAAMICGFKIHISQKVLTGLDWFRKILWAVLMLLLWTDCLTEWMDLELFKAFQFESASWWIIGAAILFVALSTIVSRPYCRFVCPTGSLFKRAENLG